MAARLRGRADKYISAVMQRDPDGDDQQRQAVADKKRRRRLGAEGRRVRGEEGGEGCDEDSAHAQAGDEILVEKEVAADDAIDGYIEKDGAGCRLGLGVEKGSLRQRADLMHKNVLTSARCTVAAANSCHAIKADPNFVAPAALLRAAAVEAMPLIAARIRWMYPLSRRRSNVCV
jgi:hypothetical protein